MDDEKFITKLFIFFIVFIFIIIACTPIVFFIVKTIDNNYIMNNGQEITAKISYRSILDTSNRYQRNYNDSFSLSDLTRTYFIEYSINNTVYTISIDSTEKNHKEGELISIYYLPDNPNKIYIPLQDRRIILGIIIISPISSFIAYRIIRNNNIFKRKKS